MYLGCLVEKEKYKVSFNQIIFILLEFRLLTSEIEWILHSCILKIDEPWMDIDSHIHLRFKLLNMDKVQCRSIHLGSMVANNEQICQETNRDNVTLTFYIVPRERK